MQRLIVAAAFALVALALLGILLTNDAWSQLQHGMAPLFDGSLGIGVPVAVGVVVGLAVFAGLALRLSRRALEHRTRPMVAPAWLGVAFALFSGLMLLAGWLQVQSVRGELLAERLEQQAAIARLKAQQVNDWAYERGIDVRFLVDTLKTLPLDELERQPEVKQLAELVLAQFLAGHAERVAVTLSRADGQALLTAGTLPDQEWPALAREIRQAAQLRSEMRGTIRAGGARPDGLSVAFLMPFRMPWQGGTLELVVAALIDPTIGLLRSFGAWPVPSRSSEVELVFRDGNEIVHIVPPGPTPSVPLSFRVPAATPGLLAEGLQRASVGTHGMDHHGQEVVGAVQNVSAFPWIVIAKTDYDEAMRPLERQVRNIWMMTGAMVAFAGLFMLALSFQLRLTSLLGNYREVR